MSGEDPEIGFDACKTAQGRTDGGPVAAGQVGAATGAAEQRIAGEQGVAAQQANRAGCLMRNAGLKETQAGIKTDQRNINDLICR